MKVVALVSGGKDSCYAMMKCIQYGHEIVALANLLPADDVEDELDSYMYQTVGHQVIGCYAKCMGLPLFRRRIHGSTRHHALSYRITPGDEVEDMFILLSEVKRQIPSLEAVCSGAIASDYQRLRVENICSRLGLVSFAYLWKQDQALLLRQMIEADLVAITVKVAAMGLNPSNHLGKELSTLESYLHKLNELYGINVCGEGGEYETLTLDCPLFKNARIVLGGFQVVLHSSDPISPVGILHPTAFHLERKMDDGSSTNYGKGSDLCPDEPDLVCEVQDTDEQTCEVLNVSTDRTLSLLEVDQAKLHVSRTRKKNIFSLSCWSQNSCEISADLQVDLELVLTKIELQLVEYGYSWENVLYIHLYIADMNKFATANETYVRFITQEKCRFGVPSRSTIELPLMRGGLGKAYVEVLVTDNDSKRVLHVQSISCWAPSCIGPYSQATLHNDILYMAGQLGLDPPTMLLSSGGPTSELEKALENGEAVAKCFNCSIYTSAVLIVIYCSESLSESDRIAIQNRSIYLLKDSKPKNSGQERSRLVLDPILLYILVPDLPKRSFVEVKPILYTGEIPRNPSDAAAEDSSMETSSCWGFRKEDWHTECLQQCVIPGKLCAAVISIKINHAEKICSTSLSGDDTAGYKTLTEEQIEKIARFFVCLLHRILLESHFTWDDVTSLRIHVATSLLQPVSILTPILTRVFDEFGEVNQQMQNEGQPIFNIVPVLGAGRSAISMDDILTCELFSIKSC